MSIQYIRRFLLSKVGNKIVVIYYGGRNKREMYEGILEKIYKNVFTIKLDNLDLKCFSYSDILSKTIKIYI